MVLYKKWCLINNPGSVPSATKKLLGLLWPVVLVPLPCLYLRASPMDIKACDNSAGTPYASICKGSVVPSWCSPLPWLHLLIIFRQQPKPVAACYRDYLFIYFAVCSGSKSRLFHIVVPGLGGFCSFLLPLFSNKSVDNFLIHWGHIFPAIHIYTFLLSVENWGTWPCKTWLCKCLMVMITKYMIQIGSISEWHPWGSENK